MGLIATLLSGLGVSLAVKAGKKVAEVQGWMPVAHYHMLAAEAVESGDLDGAILNNLRARRRDSTFAPALAQREMLLLAVNRHKAQAQKRLAEAERAKSDAERHLRRVRAVRWLVAVLAAVSGVIGGFVAGAFLGVLEAWITIGCGATAAYAGWRLSSRSVMQAVEEARHAEKEALHARKEEADQAARRCLLSQ